MGLKMNIAKTKVMVVDNTPINVNNVLIENVRGYVFLGQHYILKEKNQDKEILRRIMAGWAAYAKHRDIFKSNLAIWDRERTKLIDIIYTVGKMKWSWAVHSNRLKDDRWTSRVTTWRPYDKKRRQGRPAKRRRDDLDKYWSDSIWERTAQDRVIWRRHAEAFAQPRDTTAA